MTRPSRLARRSPWRPHSAVILTSDNPRNEDPRAIIDEMQQGLEIESGRQVLTVVDRREAIEIACALATSGDVLLVAGKGHERHQVVAGVKYTFSDKAVVEGLLLSGVRNGPPATGAKDPH